MEGICFLTQQSSCRQHQEAAGVAYSWDSLKDIYQCSLQSNITYQVRVCTLQPPTVKYSN